MVALVFCATRRPWMEAVGGGGAAAGYCPYEGGVGDWVGTGVETGGGTADAGAGDGIGVGADGGAGVGVGGGVSDGPPGGAVGVATLTGAPHMSQKLLPGSSWTPQLEQVNALVSTGAGTVIAGGGAGTAACGGGAGTACPKATPQLSQKASPAITDTPQTGQAVVTTVGAGCGTAGADGAAVGIACSNFAPHSSQKAAPSGCCAPQFIHIGMDFLLLPPAALAGRFAPGGDQFPNLSA
jgi:hypothetical protein